MAYQRLSAQDSSFLHVEGPTSPMHVGSLATFEAAGFMDEAGRFRIDEARRLIESRLPGVPRFRQVVCPVPLAQGRPVWVDDENFDLTYHVRLTALPRPGNEAQLLSLMARLQAQALDRNRPLWELWFVEGLEGDRVAIIQKTHHAMVDGISGVDVATVLLSLEPEDPPSSDSIEEWSPGPQPNGIELVTDALRERMSEPAEAVRAVRAAFRGPAAVIEGAIDIGKAALAVGAPGAPRLPFNKVIGPHRRFELARVDLDAVKTVKNAFGCTVNDVVLASVTGGLRHLLVDTSHPVDDLMVKALVPVSVRTEEQAGALGNRVAAFVAELPVGIDDPASRVRFIHEQLRAMKESGQALAVDRINALLDYAPPTLLSLAARLVPRQRAVNMVVTNIPGPQFPLYCMGAKMLEAFPYVGLVDNVGLVVAVVSYDGQLGFGLSADRDLVPNLNVLAEGIEKSVAELAAHS